MLSKKIATGVVHTVPKDMKETFARSPKLRDLWNDLTPLARNEWICYVTIVKKPETRKEHIERLQADLLKGKRRPCCWPGCPHRRPSAQKWFSKTCTTKASAILLFIVLTSTTSLWAWDVDLSMYHDKTLAECENNIPCTRLARWQCIAQACGEGGSQKPTDCYSQLDADKVKADAAICQADSWPSSANFQNVVESLPGAKIEDVVQGILMLRAVRGDGAGCAVRIKEYVGPYGPAWSAFWVSALSGCRILSKERTWQEEDSDYQIWKDVGSGQKQCADIKDEEMRSMCAAGVLSVPAGDHGP